jgi:RNA polymerase sigma-70 factor (ECF subfamily)
LKKAQLPAETLVLTDQETFSTLFEHTYVSLYRYLYGLTGGPPEEVDDLVAETYVRAWSARNRFQGDSKAALRWLFKIAKHQMIDSYRRQKASGESTLPDNLAAPEMDLESQVLSSERRETLWKLLRSLSDEPREVLVLRYMLDWSVGDIAVYMNKKETAISMAIHRALKRLQQNWTQTDPVLETRSESNA